MKATVPTDGTRLMFPGLLIVTMASFFLLTAVPANALYIHVDANGKVHLSSSPLGPNFQPVFPGMTRVDVPDQQQLDILNQIAAERGTPLIFLQSIVETLEEREEGTILLPPARVEEAPDTITEDPRRNIEHGVDLLEDLLRTYRRNLTVTLGKYYMGDEAFEEIEGIPGGSDARAFVDDVIDRLDELSGGDPIIYSYLDDRNRRQVVTLR